MGKNTVTYAIGFARCSPYLAEIRKKKRLLKNYRENGKEISAARLAIEIGDLLLEEADLPNDGLDKDEFDDNVEKNLHEVIKYCTAGYRRLAGQNKPYSDTIRALELLSEAYKRYRWNGRLEEYEDAIKYAKLLVERLRDKDDLAELRGAVKLLADIYFTKGHDLEKARYDDYENAKIFYLQEHKLLEKLDEDTPDIADHKRSNLFNLGVIEGKFVGGEERAMDYLARAIKSARKLNDHRSELTTWWELGNLAKRRGDMALALQCEDREFQLIEKHKFDEELVPCLVEKGICVQLLLLSWQFLISFFLSENIYPAW
ncbi:hypothetical protein BX666DRAFT_1859257 [Dichotomocladium elegans]|nr:hypothetical protein BX666DRAFT_1859257 [Dichotomocladium elegans]